MRWLRCSYREMLELPYDYIEVASDIARKEQAAQREAARRRR